MTLKKMNIINAYLQYSLHIQIQSIATKKMDDYICYSTAQATEKKSLNICALHIFFGKEWPNYCYRMARAMCFLQRLLLLFMLCSDQVSETSWCYDVDHPGELMQRWKQPSSSSSSLLTNVVMEPEVSSGRIDHVSH